MVKSISENVALASEEFQIATNERIKLKLWIYAFFNSFSYLYTYNYQGRTVLVNLGYHFNTSFLQQ